MPNYGSRVRPLRMGRSDTYLEIHLFRRLLSIPKFNYFFNWRKLGPGGPIGKLGLEKAQGTY